MELTTTTNPQAQLAQAVFKN